MTADVPDDVLLARAYLSRVGEPGDVELWAFVGRVGAVDATRALRDGRAPEDVLASTAMRRRTADPEADLAAAERRGVRLVAPESGEWPHFAMAVLERTGAVRAAERTAGRRARIEAGEPVPPLALWVRGKADLTTLGVRSAGIVGARASTEYGNRVAADLAFGLGSGGIEVVSGGAYGIDAAAHRGALAAGAVTVAVSAGGLDRPYPTGNAALFEQIAESGLLVSESPPGCAPQRHRFLSRNRLIAAFASGIVVVEAAGRSGATNTANHARRLGRPLLAVPGPVTSAMSVGCHDLIRAGATLVSCAEDVLAEIGPIGSGREPGERSPTPPVADVRAELDALDPLARRVFEGLSARRFAAPDAIAARVGVSPVEVVRALPSLDIAGLIEVNDGGYRLSARLREAPARHDIPLPPEPAVDEVDVRAGAPPP